MNAVPVVDVALGLILFYVVLSLAASAVQEWIASLLALRAKTLRQGVDTLLGHEVSRALYAHPLIKNLARKGKLPSYLDPDTVSTTVLDILAKTDLKKSYAGCSADEVKALVKGIDPQHPLKPVLEAFTAETADAAERLQDRIAAWFDHGMQRVSGWYARRAKAMIFAIAGGLTVATNASSLHTAEALWRNDALRTKLATQAQAAFQHDAGLATFEDGAFAGLETFPIGWEDPPSGLRDWAKTLLGWLITIAAVSLGAPFWFDLLGKVANLRGAGGKPRPRDGPKSSGAGAATR